ncbi:hypothetical protein SAMN03159507_01282 [Pseudomonas sp. NFACC32-1]|uniref:hypothetical protein n=1 Tax=Pseudomonas TaxID=286 RepID=UPI0008765218|nr:MULTISPECIES: hypothetical protein [Pseudomonas]MDB6444840.1 hypothetical protein [Pseudomonas sp. 21TX0197]MDT8905994.1 hypothetical protein [Pseudomonas prosekii]NHN67681.1 hypothetical protein [Pseudomonas fluorescens]SCX51583.1 hypothetical protein SAMN03159507_01282 [Pseudomonas sp. NFACC32-1]SFW90275.1 hypothetical protein SAMN03159376_05218 [Pseudomonas sp. NFACC09-4]
MISVLPMNELNRLAVTAEAEGLALSEIVPICERYCVAPTDVLNELSIAVAECYLDGSLTYAFCDGVMNGIINAIVDLSVTGVMPQPAFSLYQAFDEGEWLRSEDPPGTDAGAKYTKPVVVEIMRVLKASSEVG